MSHYQRTPGSWTKWIAPTADASDKNKWLILYCLYRICESDFDHTAITMAFDHIAQHNTNLRSVVSALQQADVLRYDSRDRRKPALPSAFRREIRGNQNTATPGRHRGTGPVTVAATELKDFFRRMIAVFFIKHDHTTEDFDLDVLTFLTLLVQPDSFLIRGCETVSQLYEQLHDLFLTRSWYTSHIYKTDITIDQVSTHTTLSLASIMVQFWNLLPSEIVPSLKLLSTTGSAGTLDKWLKIKPAMGELSVSDHSLKHNAPPSLSSTPATAMAVHPTRQVRFEDTVVAPPTAPTSTATTSALTSDPAMVAMKDQLSQVLSVLQRQRSTPEPPSRDDYNDHHDHRQRGRPRERSPYPRHHDRSRSPGRYSQDRHDRSRSPNRRFDRSRSPHRPSSDRRSDTICRDYQNGHCQRNNCRFSHENRPAPRKPCFSFQQHGYCRFGTGCRFSHDTFQSRQPSSSDNTSLPSQRPQFDQQQKDLQEGIAFFKGLREQHEQKQREQAEQERTRAAVETYLASMQSNSQSSSSLSSAGVPTPTSVSSAISYNPNNLNFLPGRR